MRAVANFAKQEAGPVSQGSPDTSTAAPQPNPLANVSIIDPRALERECFLRCLEVYRAGSVIVGYASIEEWSSDFGGSSGQVVLLSLGARTMADEDIAAEVAVVVEAARPNRVIVLAGESDVSTMLAVLTSGASGYVPPEGHFTDVLEAIRVVNSGGIYLPRTSLMMLSDALTMPSDKPAEQRDHFTDRQLSVARALQRGAANKTIAYELNLCESTVKVHIRNIMRKVKATNRTQAALRLNDLIGFADGVPH